MKIRYTREEIKELVFRDASTKLAGKVKMVSCDIGNSNTSFNLMSTKTDEVTLDVEIEIESEKK